MRKINSFILLVISLLFTTTVLAEGSINPGTDSRLSSVVALYLEALRSESEYRSASRLAQPVVTMAYASAETQPIGNLEFQDSATFARVSKIRELSLLTLAEVRGTRLFLGVNRKGLVGLHFRALAGRTDERCLEVVRMPYLGKNQPYDGDQ